MTITTTWDVTKLNYMRDDQYVFSIDFTVLSKDDVYPTYESKFESNVSLEKPDTLIPYKDITKETAITWVKDRLNELNKEDKTNLSTKNIEEITEANLTFKIIPTKLSGTPWT